MTRRIANANGTNTIQYEEYQLLYRGYNPRLRQSTRHVRRLDSVATAVTCAFAYICVIRIAVIGHAFVARELFQHRRAGRSAHAQQGPHLAYVYPAGGKRGATFKSPSAGSFC